MKLEKMVDPNKVLVEISNHHVHLSEEHLEALFGKGYELTKRKFLSQPGQYAAEETVILKHNGYEIKNVRILGPVRQQTQVEISATESHQLKINAPCKLSGDIKNTPGIIIVGPIGEVKIKEGVIIAKRHLHISYNDAEYLGIRNHQKVNLYINGERPITYHDIIVRTGHPEKTALAVHLDTDEGNSVLLNKMAYGKLVI